MSASGFEIVEFRTPNGYGFFLKSPGHGRLFRVIPMRDPDQPRFWCLRIERCTRSGVVDPGGRACWVDGGMTRDSLPEKLQAIRRDADGWLLARDRDSLRQWLSAQDEEEVAAALPLRRLDGWTGARSEPVTAGDAKESDVTHA